MNTNSSDFGGFGIDVYNNDDVANFGCGPEMSGMVDDAFVKLKANKLLMYGGLAVIALLAIGFITKKKSGQFLPKF